MIEITAQIKIEGSVGDFNASFDNAQGNEYTNNISGELGAITGVKSQGSNPFIIGASKLGSGATFSDKVDYLIGDLSDKNGNFLKSYIIKVNSSQYKKFGNITIAFDIVSGRYPKSIKVNGVDYADDDAIFTIADIDTNSLTIEISNWNTPNSPLVITGIYDGITIDIDRRNLISFEYGIFDRGDINLPSYGILSNTGSIEFNDVDGEVADYAEALLLTSGATVQCFLKDTLSGTETLIANTFTETWDYDSNNRQVSVSLKDDLEKWQEISVEGKSYDPYDNKPITAKDIYINLVGKTNVAKVQPFMLLDEETKHILENTIIPYDIRNAGTLWEQWQKLCQLCGLYIYKNKNGVIRPTYTNGR